MDAFGHGLVWGFGRKSGLVLYSCLLCLIWWLDLYPSLVGSPLLAIRFRVGTTWKIPLLVAWSCFSTPYTSLPSLILTPFITFPIRVHISLLGPQRVSLPFPLSTLWVELETMPQRLMQLKKKKKQFDHSQQEIVP